MTLLSRRVRYLLFFLVLLSRCSAGWALDAVSYYEDAVARYADKDYKAAEIQLKNALQADSGHLPSRLLLGRVHLRLGHPEEAEKELEHALRLGAARDKVYASLGSALLLQRKYQKVLDTMDTVNSRTPEAEQVYIFRGRAYLGLAELDKAQASFEQAARIAPDGLETLLGQAAVLTERGDLAAAESVIDRARMLYPSSLEAWYEKGRLRAAQADEEGALTSFNHILAESPNAYKTLAARGALLLKQGHVEDALADLAEVHDHVAGDFNSTFLYAEALLEVGRSDEAAAILNDLSTLVTRIPENVLRERQGLLRMATVISYLKADYEQANMYGSRYLAMRPDDKEMAKMMGAVYLKLDEPAEAIETLYRVYRQQPNDARLLLLLGEAHLRKKQYAEASHMLEKAAALVPGSAAVGTRLALGKYGLGLPGEARSELLRAFRFNSVGSTGAGFILVQLYLRQKDTEGALAVARQLVTLEPGNPVLHNLLGAVYVQAGDMDSARDAYSEASRVAPGFLGGEYNLALLDIHQGHYDQARSRLSHLLQASPKSPLVLEAMADLEKATGANDKAISWLVKATAQDGTRPESGIKLLDLYLEQGLRDDALRQGENLARRFPDNAQAIAAMARAQIAAGKEQAATDSLRRAVMHVDSRNGPLFMSLADQQAQLEDYSGARKTLLNATNTDLAPQARMALIRLDLATGNSASAEESLAALGRLTDNAAVLALAQGDIRLQQHRYREAQAAYTKSFTLSPGTLSALGVFRSRFLQGEHTAAQNELAQWCSQHPDDAMARQSLARSLLSTGRRAEAQQQFEQLIAAGLGSAEDYAYLARIYQLNGDERALATAESAAKMAPESAQVLDVYGWILVTSNRVAEGLPLLREAVSRDSDLFLRYHLASALNEAGRPDEARLELQAILRAGRNLPWLESAQALYDKLSGR